MIEQIKLDQVTFQYPGAEDPVLRDVSLTIEKGTFTAIIGGNGSGKSTLCKLLNGLIPHYYVGDFSGEVTVNGLVTTDEKVAKLSEHVGYVYQDFENQLVSPHVLEDACFAPLHFGYEDYRERGERALSLVGLTDYADEFIWQLSGGQKHLLALAGALALDPDILIIDEPVAQLDPQHAEEIYHILKKLHEEYGKTIIVIEHHTEFIASFCREVIMLDQGKLIWQLPVVEALQKVDELMQHQIYPPQVTQAGFRLNQAEQAKLPVTLAQAIPYFNQQEASFRLNLETEMIPVEHEKKAIAQLEDVHFSYKTITRSRNQVLKGIDLTVYEGDHIALVGNNGAGKSSLMRLITGLVKPGQGNVLVNGTNTKEVPPETLADFVTYVYQNPEQMFIDDSVRKDISFFLKSRKVPNYETIVDQVLEQFDLVDLQERDSRLMSGGQQRRASLAIGMAMNPKLMLLDEPTANLDIATRKHISALMTKLKEQVEAVVIATHDMQLVAEWANRIVVVHNGKVIHDGDRYSVFGNAALLARAGLKAPQILELSRALGLNPPIFTVDAFVEAWNKEGSKHGVYA
ncbi:putative HMP/thiamine import ATP-binding protein YkoD [Paraliobacillus ryukyuensis]|uniref:Energy-coupling factor transport system ATP-binding protein n=1 Tax=Paraliobacillus ryukyuensis TaxID=200904 RepID=A0A366EEE5_9BACI|nr:energy-coupling factor transporter ATPase [Paraliobacillus ryukyuensis]RBP00762.1 energy-coupling factor transport system ATP-binding protein [Paraliobacillus ryukyuensis]